MHAPPLHYCVSTPYNLFEIPFSCNVNLSKKAKQLLIYPDSIEYTSWFIMYTQASPYDADIYLMFLQYVCVCVCGGGGIIFSWSNHSFAPYGLCATLAATGYLLGLRI